MLPWFVIALAAGATTWLLLPAPSVATLGFELGGSADAARIERLMGVLTVALGAESASEGLQADGWRWESPSVARRVVTVLGASGASASWRAVGERAAARAMRSAQQDESALAETAAACDRVARASAALSAQVRLMEGGTSSSGDEAVHNAADGPEGSAASASEAAGRGLLEAAGRLEVVATDLSATQASHEQARREREELEAADPSTVGAVEEGDRQKAYAADVPWAQDTAELAAHFAEARSALQAAHERASEAADRAVGAARVLDERIELMAQRPELKEQSAPIADLKKTTSDYTALWASFFPALQAAHKAVVEAADVDGALARLKEYEEVRRDFLIDADRTLSDINDRLARLREAPSASAALVAAVSNAAREASDAGNGFHAFERAVGSARPVRLQAALEAIDRLSARTRHRAREIDQQLAADAARRAGDDRLARLARLDQTLRDLQTRVGELSAQVADAARSLAHDLRSALDAMARHARMQERAEMNGRLQRDLAELELAARGLSSSAPHASSLPAIRFVQAQVAPDEEARRWRWEAAALATIVCLGVALSARLSAGRGRVADVHERR